ncbi:MAG: hypothetical protein ABS46_20130 [Cytophagaceae bacterium SCN 52-12]|nr:MAG: hypothetical protein ABS46_20130 [Cytophagaceae bacterium SCN 52-12]
MDMAKRVAQKMAELWQLHGNQMFVFKIAMREELPGDLRGLCGKGYLIASLCMKEIAAIYDQLKSPLDDRSLQVPEGEITELAEVPGLSKGRSAELMIRYLRFKQCRLLKKYTRILGHFDKTEANLKVLRDHIFVLKRLAERLEGAGAGR